MTKEKERSMAALAAKLAIIKSLANQKASEDLKKNKERKEKRNEHRRNLDLPELRISD